MKKTNGICRAGAIAMALTFVGGCSSSAPNEGQASNTTTDTPVANASPHAATPTTTDPKAKDSGTTASSPWDALGKTDASKEKDASQKAPPASNPPASAVAPGEEVKKAEVGMGEKGRGYGSDVFTQPVFVYWNVKERLSLDLIQKNLELYKANDPDGKGPKTHEEFMKKIVQENDIKLPTLPEGHRYHFDPVKQELDVIYPKDQK